MGVSKDSVADSTVGVGVTFGKENTKGITKPLNRGGVVKDIVNKYESAAENQRQDRHHGHLSNRGAVAGKDAGSLPDCPTGQDAETASPQNKPKSLHDKSQENEKKDKPCDPRPITKADLAALPNKTNGADAENTMKEKDEHSEQTQAIKSDNSNNKSDKETSLEQLQSLIQVTDVEKSNKKTENSGHGSAEEANKGRTNRDKESFCDNQARPFRGSTRGRDGEVIPMDEIDGPNPSPVRYRRIDPDKASVFSLYMERDFRYYFQHPYLRLGIAYFVTFCNFLIYAEDPVAHSSLECQIPVVGNCFAFVFTRYPDNGWSVLKVLLWLTAIICGLIVGKLVIHKVLFGKLFRLKMFSEEQGSWMAMFFTVILFVFTFSYLYNAFLMIGGEPLVPYFISSKMGIPNSWFMKAAACGTWCGDFFTAWMVTDIMLQEKLYPEWAVRIRKKWKHGYLRIILFWCIVTTTSIVVVTAISTDIILWDKLNRDFLPTNELSRSFLASFILVMDLLILMQDWDFPHFINNLDIKLPGVNVTGFKFRLPRFMMKDKYTIHITGKWFNYGIIFIVMLLDLNMWKNQIFYIPVDYAQYTNSTGKIFSVRDKYSLQYLNESQMNYEWRASNINPVTNRTFVEDDVYMNSRFYGTSLPLKCIAFIPCIAAMICIGVLVYMFGRFRPTEQDPYAGRLKKRKRRRSRRRKSSIRMYKEAGPAIVFDGKNYVATRTNQSYPENWKP